MVDADAGAALMTVPRCAKVVAGIIVIATTLEPGSRLQFLHQPRASYICCPSLASRPQLLAPWATHELHTDDTNRRKEGSVLARDECVTHRRRARR